MLTNFNISALYLSLLFTSTSYTAYCQKENTHLWKNEIFHSYDPNNEIIALRSENSKHFINPSTGENEAIFSSGRLHYLKNQKWETIFNTIEPNNTGKYQSYAYCNTHNSHQIFYSDGSNAYRNKIILENGKIIDENIDMRYYFIDDNNEIILNSITIPNFNAETNIERNQLTITDFYSTHIDLKIEHHSGAKKMDYIIKNSQFLQNIPYNSKYLIFEETILLPEGYTAKLNEDGHIDLLDENLSLQSQYLKPCFKDSYQPITRDSNLTRNRIFGTYKILQIENKLVIQTQVPIDWLNNNQRVFPIFIDPTINIYANLSNNTGYTDGGYDIFNGYGLIAAGLIYGYYYYTDWVIGFQKFLISGIPSGSTVSNTSINFYIYFNSFWDQQLVFTAMNNLTTYTTWNGLFNGIDLSPNYGTTTNMANRFGWQSFNLGTLGNSNVLNPSNQMTIGTTLSGTFYPDEWLEYYGNTNANTTYLAVTYTTPLPVQLKNFNGICINHQINIQWETASEKNNAYFVVEKSYDATHWTYVNRISGQGNSNTTQNYSIIDTDASNTMIYYRLTQVDFDGKEEVFSPIQVHNCNGIQLPNLTVFPNPVENSAQIEITSPIEISNAQLTILDMNGKIIHSRQIALAAGTQQLPLSTENWASGVYHLHVSSEEVAFKTLKFIKR